MKISAAHVNDAHKALSARTSVSERPQPQKPPAAGPVDTFERSAGDSKSPLTLIKPSPLATSPLSLAQTPPTDAQNPAPPSPVAGAADRIFNEKDREALLEAWGARTGEQRFAADYDLDGDGRIGSADLALLLGRFENAAPAGGEPAAPIVDDDSAGQTNPQPQHPDVQSLLAAFGRRAGEEGFDASHDLDGDGVITSTDLALLLGRLSAPETPAAVESPAPRSFTQDDVQRLTALWNTRAGHELFDEAYDLDGDGVIGSADLARMLGRLA